MISKLSPQSTLPQQDLPVLRVSKRSDVLTINGLRLDFRPVTEGATLPQATIDCLWIAEDVIRVNGQLIVPIFLPYGDYPTPAAMFPTDIVDPADGNVELLK